MATNYHDVLADIALRVNAIRGPIPATLQNNYAERPLTSSLFSSSIYPFSACISALLLAEEKLARAMASTSNPILRAPLHSITAALTPGAVVPTTDVNSVSIIGILGSVRDSSDGLLCNEKTLEEIARRNRNAGSFYRLPMYAYKFDGERIEHTRTTVVIDCCVYDRAAQLEAVTIDDPMLLPDDMGEALVCGGVAALVRDDEDTAQANLFAQYFADTLTRLAGGLTPVQSKVIPGPTMTATST
jgi:hypothetical protein